MPGRPAARITDMTSTATPLSPGPGSMNVIIGYLPGMAGSSPGHGRRTAAAQSASDTLIKAAEAATLAAAGTPGAPARETGGGDAENHSGRHHGIAVFRGGRNDGHARLSRPLPIPPHGPGVVIDGSATVMINNLPACRMGDTVLEALGGPDKIMKGEFQGSDRGVNRLIEIFSRT